MSAETTHKNKNCKQAKFNEIKHVVMSRRGGSKTRLKTWLTGMVSGKAIPPPPKQ
jgi:hypothetical protein